MRQYVVDDEYTRERWRVTARFIAGAWRELGAVLVDEDSPDGEPWRAGRAPR